MGTGTYPAKRAAGQALEVIHNADDRFMLMVVDALVWPTIHVEIEAVALVPPGR